MNELERKLIPLPDPFVSFHRPGLRDGRTDSLGLLSVPVTWDGECGSRPKISQLDELHVVVVYIVCHNLLRRYVLNLLTPHSTYYAYSIRCFI